jgi:transposase InsO family protein/transposase
MKPQTGIEERTKIVNEYFKGASVPTLCIQYQVKKSALYSWIKRSKNELTNSRFEASLDNKHNIVSQIENGKSVKEVCALYHLKQSTVYHWMHQYGLNHSDIDIPDRKQKPIDVNRLVESVRILKQTSITNDMNTLEKYELIRSLSADHSLVLLCELFDMSRSTFYSYSHKKIPAHLRRDKDLKRIIMETYLRHKKRIGAAKIKHDMSLRNLTVSLKKVYQLMKELNISRIVPKKNPYLKPPKKTNLDCRNLLHQQFDQKAPDLVWASDITEIKINQRPVYLCAIMDLFSRKIIAYQVSRKNNTRLTLLTLAQAIENRTHKPNLFHSDRGVQYTALKFRKQIRKWNITQSFSAPGYPYDNSPMESFFATFKRETVKIMLPFKLIQDYIRMVKEYMQYYNNDRPHRSLGMRTPNHVEAESILLS